jgi:hypothetical protein
MIAKCKAISHGRAMLEYAMRESKIDAIVMRNMVGGTTPAEVLSEFELVNGYNTRCRNKYLRFEIGIAPGDREKLKPGDLNKIVKRFAEKMGLDNHQFIAVTHKDTKNLHIHLIANRIGVDGKVYDTEFVSNRSARAAEEISRELGLTIAKEVRAKREHVVQGQSRYRLAAREELQRLAYESLRKCKSPDEFFADLKRKGVRVEQVKNKQGKVYGLWFEYKCEVFKASEIGREFGLHSLFNHYGQRLEGQKGEAFIPQYLNEPLSMVGETGRDRTALSMTGEVAAGVVGGLIESVGAVAEIIGGAMGGFSDTPPADDEPETVVDAEERRRRRLKKLKRTQGKSRGRGI